MSNSTRLAGARVDLANAGAGDMLWGAVLV